MMVAPTILESIDLNSIQDLEQARQAIVMLFNLIEDLQTTIRQLQEENQRLRDENNRLTGEQGQPKVKPNTHRHKPVQANHSSEAERRKPQEWHKRTKRDQVRVDREQVLTVAPEQLPADAAFKGYEDVVVQDIEIRTDNVLYHKEKYYSPSARQTYLAALPAGYEGQFGPGIKALTLVQYFACNMSEPKILEFLHHVGIVISAGAVSNLLVKNQTAFHTEQDAIFAAGLQSSPWQHYDHTATRVNGDNHHCHVVCNPLYTAFFTTARKDRLSVLDILRNRQARTFRLNEEAAALLRTFGLSQRVKRGLQALPHEQDLTEATLHGLLDEQLPRLGSQQRQRILEATAIAAYHAQLEFPVVQLLVCDDAPQFNWLTTELALCWVHEGRHYKKLAPYVPQHRVVLENFIQQFWDFYDQLLAYREQPSAAEQTGLAAAFDTLFSTITGYQALDERIEKTRHKKPSLLMVLAHPEIPLHNNPAELGARLRVRKRDVSFGPRTPDGAKAWDTFMTLTATAKKLGVSIYDYLHDRVSGAYQMPPLADLITARARQRPLDLSWNRP
jgi:regulator of replication initiation timing